MRGGGLFSANGTGSEGKGGGRREERGKYTSGLGKGLQREMQQMKVGDKEALTAILDGKKGGEKGYRAYDTEDEQISGDGEGCKFLFSRKRGGE